MKKTKSMKVAEYFLAHPTALPKVVGAKFKMHMPQVYGIRKRVLSGSMLGDVVNPQITDAVTQFKPSNRADDLQIGGDHYKNMGIQPWKAMESWMSPEEFRGFLKGNSIKYLARCNAKGGVEDVKKARHYIDKLVEVMNDDDPS